jgi:hypothetical protein
MSEWLYRSMMAILAIMFVGQVYIIVTQPEPVVGCINNIIMEQHQDMWIQKGIWPRHCIMTDKD